MTITTTPLVVIVGRASYGGAWGKGTDLAAAKRAFRKNYGLLGYGYTTFTFADDSSFAGVDDMGNVFWDGDAPAIVTKPAAH